MGYVRHHAIVVTSWNKEKIPLAVELARKLGCQVLGPSIEVVNGYTSILICPDGNKEGWSDSAKGDERRYVFVKWLRSQVHEDGSGPFEWVELAFGADGPEPEVVNFSEI